MAKVTKRGNSLGVNIPPDLLKILKWKENTEIEFDLKGKKLVIQEVKQMTTLKLETATGAKMEFTGTKYRYDDKTKIHYLDAASYPDSIVREVKEA